MKYAAAVCFAATVLAACQSKPPQTQIQTQNVEMPDGTTVRMIGEGPAPAPKGTRKLGLRYQTDLAKDDTQGLHKEALAIWKFFRFQAEGQGYSAAVVTAQDADGTRTDFNFVKHNGAWTEASASGTPVVAAPQHLAGPMASYDWMPGIWKCSYRFMPDKFAKAYLGIVINEVAGDTIDQTFSESYGPGAVLGETIVGYDAGRKVWYRHGKQAPATVDDEEATGPYSPDMQFGGTTSSPQAGKTPARKRFTVNAARDRVASTTEVYLKSKWTTVARGACDKEK